MQIDNNSTIDNVSYVYGGFAKVVLERKTKIIRINEANFQDGSLVGFLNLFIGLSAQT